MSKTDCRNKNNPKDHIDYAPIYRHLKPMFKMMAVYFFFFTLPIAALFLIFHGEISLWMAQFTQRVLTLIMPNVSSSIQSIESIGFFGSLSYVILPSNVPTVRFALINLILSIIAIILAQRVKRSFLPITLFARFLLTYHILSCLFVIITQGSFPYSLATYSELYMIQQMGIWFAFILISGLIAGYISHSGISKYVMLVSLVSYSFVFGVLRYIVFLTLLYKSSSLYMTVLYFGFGPIIDFLYLVFIYSLYMSRLTRHFEEDRSCVTWHWA
jgi:hypothetical protein